MYKIKTKNGMLIRQNNEISCNYVILCLYHCRKIDRAGLFLVVRLVEILACIPPPRCQAVNPMRADNTHTHTRIYLDVKTTF